MAGSSAIEMASARMRISSAHFGSVEQLGRHLGQRRHRMLGAADGGDYSRLHRLAGVLQGRDEQVLLRTEVLVQRGLGAAGGGRDLRRRRGVVAAAAEDGAGGVEDGVAALVAGHPAEGELAKRRRLVNTH